MSVTELTTIIVEENHPVLTITLNRPKLANAMNLVMVDEISAAMQKAEDEKFRVLVIKGNAGNFCAGGDIKEMQHVTGDSAALVDLNRAFGRMISKADTLPLVVVCALQGAVLGGGFGLACVSDVAIADQTTKFGMPETSLGIIPAQIAPFVAKRVGVTHARRLALLGLRIKSDEALRLNIIHETVSDEAALNAAVDSVIKSVLRCAPNATAYTKSLVHSTQQVSSADEMNELLDDAAKAFSTAITGDEGKEGAAAFIGKRKAAWATA